MRYEKEELPYVERPYARYDRRKMEFSKRLTLIVVCFFIFSCLAGWASWIMTGEPNPTQLLEYAHYALVIVLGGYFAKAGVENVKKYKEPPGQGEKHGH